MDDGVLGLPAPWLLAATGSAVLLALALAVVRVVPATERLVVSRLGRPPVVRGPGLVLLRPVLDRAWRVGLHDRCLDLLVVEEVTRDGVPVRAHAVAVVAVRDPIRYAVGVDHPGIAAATLVEASLRRHVRAVDLEDLLDVEGERSRAVSPAVQDALHEWGLHATGVEISRVELQPQPHPARPEGPGR